MRDSPLFLFSTPSERTILPSSSSLVTFNLCHGRGTNQAPWTGAGARTCQVWSPLAPRRSPPAPGRSSARPAGAHAGELAGTELTAAGARLARPSSPGRSSARLAEAHAGGLAVPHDHGLKATKGRRGGQ
jgi:hypothetical protein